MTATKTSFCKKNLGISLSDVCKACSIFSLLSSPLHHPLLSSLTTDNFSTFFNEKISIHCRSFHFGPNVCSSQSLLPSYFLITFFSSLYMRSCRLYCPANPPPHKTISPSLLPLNMIPKHQIMYIVPLDSNGYSSRVIPILKKPTRATSATTDLLNNQQSSSSLTFSAPFNMVNHKSLLSILMSLEIYDKT